MFFPTLVHEYLTQSAQKFPDKEALICGEERWRYREIDQSSGRLACILRDMGLKRGDRVVILLDNSSESVISLYGILKSGGVFILLDGTTKAKRLNYILNDSGASILITHTNKKDVVKDALDDYAQIRQIIWVGDSALVPSHLSTRSTPWRNLFPTDGKEDGRIVNFMGGGNIDLDLAALIYTSGSTGEPKGVMSAHTNMISAARSIIQYLENTSDDIIINALPLSFDYGLYQVIMAFIFSGTVVLEKGFVYPNRFLGVIQKERVTGLPLVPTMAAILLRMQNLGDYDFRALRYISNTAAALPVEHILKMRSLFSHVRLYSMYGLTECKRVSYLPPEELDRRPSSVGRPIPNSEVFVLDEEGKEKAAGETGELVVRGAHVMRGYWNAPGLTDRIFRPGLHPGEKLLYTGDLFRRDEEGFLYFVGRKDDLIKTRGERVSPKEVENVIVQMEGVGESAVIGIPDEILGQAIRAFVVVTPGASITEMDLLKHCKENLESFKIPRDIYFLDRLPLTANGKVDKKKLLEMEGGG